MNEWPKLCEILFSGLWLIMEIYLGVVRKNVTQNIDPTIPEMLIPKSTRLFLYLSKNDKKLGIRYKLPTIVTGKTRSPNPHEPPPVLINS